MTDILTRAKARRELAAKATPGPWKWWTSNSWRRLTSGAPSVTLGDRRDGGVLCPTAHHIDHHPDLIVKQEDMDHIEACSPEAIIELCDALIAADERETEHHKQWLKLIELVAARIRSQDG